VKMRVSSGLLFVAFIVGIGAGILSYRALIPRRGEPTVDAALPLPGAPGNLQSSGRTGRYTDDDVKSVVERWTANDPDDETFLRVVPAGTSAPLLTVFGALGLDLARLGAPTEAGANHVVYLTWQVSPSYTLKCMTAINDSDNEGLSYTDPKRRLYGIRIVKRTL